MEAALPTPYAGTLPHHVAMRQPAAPSPPRFAPIRPTRDWTSCPHAGTLISRGCPMETLETAHNTHTIEIHPLQPGEDATAFRTLNEEWITRSFTLEAKDIETLGDPENANLRKGGHIFLARAVEASE